MECFMAWKNIHSDFNNDTKQLELMNYVPIYPSY